MSGTAPPEWSASKLVSTRRWASLIMGFVSPQAESFLRDRKRTFAKLDISASNSPRWASDVACTDCMTDCLVDMARLV